MSTNNVIAIRFSASLLQVASPLTCYLNRPRRRRRPRPRPFAGDTSEPPQLPATYPPPSSILATPLRRHPTN
jgi:hypothetical protein